MSRLANSCLLLPLLCSAAAGATRTIARGDDRTTVPVRHVIRTSPNGFVIAAEPRVAANHFAAPSVALGGGVRFDRALFDAHCRTEKGASYAPGC